MLASSAISVFEVAYPVAIVGSVASTAGARSRHVIKPHRNGANLPMGLKWRVAEARSIALWSCGTSILARCAEPWFTEPLPSP